MTTLIIVIVVVLVVAAAAAFLIQKKNREANISRAEELRSDAAARAQTTIAPAQQEAAEAEARAEEARVQAERAQAEAREKQVAAQQVEAEHEAQVRDADRLDPRVDDRSDDYAPQVGGTTDQQPTPPSEVNRAPEAESAHESAHDAPATTTTEQPAAAPAPGTATPGDHTTTTHEPTTSDDATTADEQASTPGLPQRTRGAQEMPGKPIEKTDEGGGWFTRKDSSTDDDRA